MMYLAMRLLKQIEVTTPFGSTVGVNIEDARNGLVGCCFAFSDREAALSFCDGDTTQVVPIEFMSITPPVKEKESGKMPKVSKPKSKTRKRS